MQAIDEISSAQERLDFGTAGRSLYDFFWDLFADWYVEAAKTRLYSQDADAASATQKVPILIPIALGTICPLRHHAGREPHQSAAESCHHITPVCVRFLLNQAYSLLVEVLAGKQYSASSLARPEKTDIFHTRSSALKLSLARGITGVGLQYEAGPEAGPPYDALHYRGALGCIA